MSAHQEAEVADPQLVRDGEERDGTFVQTLHSQRLVMPLLESNVVEVGGEHSGVRSTCPRSEVE
jgi:hypothetical protein